MPTIVTSSQQGNHLDIAIMGRFDFSILKDFRNAYTKNTHTPILAISIDMSRSEHLDSSGMGLLLTMKKELRLNVSSIELNNCRPHIRDALMAARLDHFFKIN